MRGWFARWGLPDRVRVDHGNPWSTRKDLPSAMALWWIGLGIEVIYNRPRRPTDNALVERCQGLIEPWAEPTRCPNFATWEERLAEVCQIQREEYETARGCTRLEAYPQLKEVRRPYQEETEEEQWQLARVLAYLAQGRWPRQVSKIGQIHIYGQRYCVGRRYRRQQVIVYLDAERVEWVVQGTDGTELKRHAAKQLTAERIRALKVSQPRPLSNKEKARQMRKAAEAKL
jgi:hypothetical protein